MKLKVILALGLLALSGSAAYAANHHPMAGCGLVYWLGVRDNSSQFKQVIASLFNNAFGSQSFGVSSGTMGCTEDGMVKADSIRMVFAEANFRSLSKELASGRGEFASAFAGLMGCRPESVPGFLSFAKSRYEKLFPSAKTTPVEMVSTLESEMVSDPAISGSCTL